MSAGETRSWTTGAIPIPEARHYALIYAPHGRDAEVATSLLKEAGILSKVAGNYVEFRGLLSDAVLFVLMTEEALRREDLKPLHDWTTSQPTWSDMPFIVLTQRGAGPERNPAAERLVKLLGNVSFLERPFHPTTFVSVAHTARTGRSRQFQARASLEALHEGELRLKTALHAGRLGSWELDLSSMTLQASAVCKGVFGRGAEDAFGYEDLIGAIHPDDRVQMRDAVGATIETGSDYEIEYRNCWPDGSVHWADIRGRLVRDREGRPARLVGVSSDITDRKQAEKDLRSVNDLLERRVEERTQELRMAHQQLLNEAEQREKAEARLRQSQKIEALGQLTGGVAHDFNNLLMAVLGNLELAQKRVEDDPKTVRLVNGAIEGAKRGASLTKRLLAFARQQELEVRPVDLSALVPDMLDLLVRSVGSSIEIVTDITDGLPPVLGDANQIELALLNLAVNARDAMPGGGRITIGLQNVKVGQSGDDLPAGDYVSLTLADTGTGMNDETLRRAIDPFFSTKELGKGTGLGLSMIHGLAVQLGGAFRLTSKLGHGTRAEILLPAAQAVAQVRPSAEPVEHLTVEVRPLTILVVDDDVLIAMSTVDMIEDLGHKAIEANSPADALAIVASRQDIDMMMTDFSMPQMNGADLANAVLQQRPGLPIVIATGYADLPPGTSMELPRLSKPYSQQQLAQQIAVLTSGGLEADI